MQTTEVKTFLSERCWYVLTYIVEIESGSVHRLDCMLGLTKITEEVTSKTSTTAAVTHTSAVDMPIPTCR